MRVCDRLLEWVQIIDYKGTVRLCGWLKDNVIGCLSENTMEEIYHGEKANMLRNKLASGDYSACIVDACPYLAMNEMDKHLKEVNEFPRYPEKLCLAFEEVCNYKCISCTTPCVMPKLIKEKVEKGYDIIEERLKEVLPHVKTISANGKGELFASKRILKILSEWKPLAPKDEITVELESNGSLFDEVHWKQIENLGQYNLHVAITVMSFEEDIYQALSGCNLPISQIENNLRFIKKLREEGIVNYFEIATVVQDRNFRKLPEFARRCVEEFGADYVRLRPYMPWGSQEPHIEWFMNVRNRKHPYHEEYKKIWEDPIFKHSKVHDWSGGLETEYDIPYKIDVIKKKILMDIMTTKEAFEEKINLNSEKKIAIYGIGEIGKIVVDFLVDNGISPIYIIDMYTKDEEYKDIPIIRFNQKDTKDDIRVIITTLTDRDKIQHALDKNCYTDYIFLKDCYEEGNKYE